MHNKTMFHILSHISISWARPWAVPIKFILPEFVAYLWERGVLCVGNIFDIETALGECNVFAQSVQQTQCWFSVGPAS